MELLWLLWKCGTCILYIEILLHLLVPISLIAYYCFPLTSYFFANFDYFPFKRCIQVPYIWNSDTEQRETITGIQLFHSFKERLLNLVALSLVLSFLIHFDFKPFEDSVELTGLYVSIDHFFHSGHLCNSYCMTSK